MEEEYYDYAPFLHRLIAIIIDGAIVSTALSLVFTVLGGFSLLSSGMFETPIRLSEEDIILIASTISIFSIFSLISQWLYFALMESSRMMGTIGKNIMGIVVTDQNGDRINFARASGRYFGKIISAMIMYFGFIMAAFTEKKQALHDMMSGCLVMKK